MTVVEILPPPAERRARLRELEDVIARSWEHVVEVGVALREIRDTGLYLELGEGLTFEQYVRTRWALPKTTAYQRIDMARLHEATSAIADFPISNEWAGRELLPVLRSHGGEGVAEAWSKIAERYRDQRPPTAREVHKALVEDGYREQAIGPSSGPVNRRIRFGQFGDKLIAATKRLDHFVNKELGDHPLGKSEQAMAEKYRAIAEHMADTLKLLAGGEVPE